jgi:hypothetical protein
MSGPLRFYRDGRFNSFASDDDSLSALGSLLIDDVMNSTAGALYLLEKVENVRSGVSTHEAWEGNGWVADISTTGLHAKDLHSDDWEGDYGLDLVRSTVLDYLRFIAPTAADRSDALGRWEDSEGRPHPVRADV